MPALFYLLLPAFVALKAVLAINAQPYVWKNVKTGGGGGFVPGIVFSTKQQGVAYARTDMGGIYKLNADDTWTPLMDWVGSANWCDWGPESLALDPTDAQTLYVATGLYTSWWDPDVGSMYKSVDGGSTWTSSKLPFKLGSNMPGRGLGERLAVDPKLPSVLYFGARSGYGLWKSTDSGVTWSKVTGFTWPGTYVEKPSDSSGYASDIVGISWVTFDSTSGTAGSPTPRIFVGVANMGANSVFVSDDAGATWRAVPGQPTQFIPHKGVISPSEKLLYISYANGAGPFDGKDGHVYKYNVATGVWTDISPVPSGSDRYFGFGGLAVDLKKPGTIMVAALNSWKPDGQIWRSTDSGTTWSPLWAWTSNDNRSKYYSWDTSLAPWLSGFVNGAQVGWMMEALVIDPFDSDHWLYGTGASVWGGHDLTNWDVTHNVTLKSLADGIEETAVLALISPPTGPNLFSGVGDIGGFAHVDLDKAPSSAYTNPTFTNTVSLDYAGNKPSTIIRIGNSNSDKATRKIALSYDSGASWSEDDGAALGVYGGVAAISADADTILWRDDGSNTVKYSHGASAFTASTGVPPGAVIASDKKINTKFYAASENKAYVSNDGGVSFTAAGTLGVSTKVSRIIANWATGGDLWIATNVGLFHSSDFAASFRQIPGFTSASGVALGAPKITGDYPVVFASAVYSGTTGYFRSDDAGVNWVQINDAAHGFGSISANVISGDPRVYGRIYIGTNGRGIFYGDMNGAQPSNPVNSFSESSTSAPVTPPTTTNAPASTGTATPTTTHTLASTRTATRTARKTVRKTVTKTTTTATAASTSTAGPWGQCGGTQDYSGPTSCVSGWTCVPHNPFYSQCLQQ